MQTTNAVAMSCVKVEIQPGCTGTWWDVSGATSSVAGTEQSKFVGEAYTFDGDAAIIKAGKKQPLDLVFNIVYTEPDAEVFDRARTVFEATGCSSLICVRWTPKGGNVGDQQYTAGGELTTFVYPPGDAGTAGPIMSSFTVHVPKIVTAVITS